MKYDIPPQFLSGDDDETNIAQTVDELISLLQELPLDMPVHTSAFGVVKVKVYNLNYEDCHVCIEDAD